DTTSPSIATLADLVRALGASLAEFFQDPPDRPRKMVFGKEDWVVSGASEEGFELTFLIPEAHGNEMEPVLITLEPGRSTAAGPAHEGEEFGFVLSGQVELRVGETTHRVRKHECFYYPADAVHRIVNTGKTRAQLLWVSCPPCF
ncbi:MAG: cupin domain-containing protein, partial [Proteobacteria bacterium]|nr:cupin domain-containing protein [Pseudomonadota bacterium]